MVQLDTLDSSLIAPMSGSGLMDRSSRLEYPRLVTDDVVAYWYFYLPYRAISQGHPSEFLIAKIAKILEEIQADFRPTVLWGKWPTRNGQLPPGGSDTFS